MNSTTSTQDLVIGVDIGGTFTDCAIVLPDGRSAPGKSPTTPHDRSEGFFASIEDAGNRVGLDLHTALQRCRLLIHGTTTGTNALIERSGAQVGLVTTTGHGDASLIMKGEGRLVGIDPDQIWDLPGSDKPEFLVPRALIREVHERIDFRGRVVVPLDEVGVVAAADELVEAGAQAIAISFLWSVRNDTHERRAADLIAARHPGVFVTAAASVSPYVGEYERTMAGIVNAYIGPLMIDYVDRIERRAADLGYYGRLLFAQAAGGAITGDEVRLAPVRTVHSGPVSGLLGSAHMADAMGRPDLIVADMGGTSFDVSVIRDHRPDLRDVSTLERFQVALPMVYVDTVGAGGGSVAWIDSAGELQVGPRSAGALPGPACYGRGGTEPTVTDADVVLGIVDPDAFLHGERRLDVTAARKAIATISEPLGMSIEQAAAGINRIIDAKMADLLRRMSVQRGFDPREFTVFAYGGGGPVHGAAVARDVGVRTLVVPLVDMASAWCAYGATVSDMVHVVQHWESMTLPCPPEHFAETFSRLEKHAHELLASEGFDDPEMRIERSIKVKYTTQLHTIELPIQEGSFDQAAMEQIVDDFGRTYDTLHGEGAGHRAGGVTLTGFVIRAKGALERASQPFAAPAVGVTRSSRSVYWSELGERVQTPVISLQSGRIDDEMTGPMLLQLPDTVVVVRPGQTARMDNLGNLVLSI
ncbi:hydantoinase/oxoprolinase family protein [Rhodococcus sp. 14-2483-1-2]|uniref:hydantoinase/oxoprolinase family protein n=1 Tax=Rhodococcus sp. 14-2483-1-2 TaxID=2023147 RepID=UPI000B9B0BE1|nr:hydantoinase/oxoprolinase family protein [Rhodococcus sp. 14-2483-1-2]OZF26064.1 hypothetical protein CH295_25885 [Rhodococcus sp. 14-2483-1-2]